MACLVLHVALFLFFFFFVCFVLALWPCFFAGIEDAARIGFGSSVLGQHVLLIAISNNFRESNNAVPELQGISCEFSPELRASL